MKKEYFDLLSLVCAIIPLSIFAPHFNSTAIIYGSLIALSSLVFNFYSTEKDLQSKLLNKKFALTTALLPPFLLAACLILYTNLEEGMWAFFACCWVSGDSFANLLSDVPPKD